MIFPSALLVRQRPQTPLNTEIHSVAARLRTLWTMTGSPLAVVFFLFLFLFLVHFQQPVHIRFGRQKLPHFFTGTPVLGVGFLLFLQQFGILSLQVLNLGQLLHTHLVKGIFGCLMEQDFLLMFLPEFSGITGLAVGYIGLTGLGIVDDMSSQDAISAMRFSAALICADSSLWWAVAAAAFSASSA